MEMPLEGIEMVLKLIHEFSEENPQVMFSYNSTSMYEEFWSQWSNSPAYSDGGFPTKGTTSVTLLAMARIIRRGWLDDRFLPVAVNPLLLETCIFNRQHLEHVNSAEDRARLESIRHSVITPWTNELTGLLDFDTFRFLITDRVRKENDFSIPSEVVVDNFQHFPLNYKETLTHFRQDQDQIIPGNPDGPPAPLDLAPHKLWHTFLYNWSDEMIDFYKYLVEGVDHFEEDGVKLKKCHLCHDPLRHMSVFHILCWCNHLLSTMRKDRHDAVKIILHRELREAPNRKSSFFYRCDDLNVIITYGNNNNFNYPAELLNNDNIGAKYPSIVAYSLIPNKKAIVIPITVSWEKRLSEKRSEKRIKYAAFADAISNNGFEVSYNPLILGCRGVFCTDLYDLLERDFGMQHSQISSTMEEISNKLISIPFRYRQELVEE